MPLFVQSLEHIVGEVLGEAEALAVRPAISAMHDGDTSREVISFETAGAVLGSILYAGPDYRTAADVIEGANLDRVVIYTDGGGVVVHPADVGSHPLLRDWIKPDMGAQVAHLLQIFASAMHHTPGAPEVIATSFHQDGVLFSAEAALSFDGLIVKAFYGAQPGRIVCRKSATLHGDAYAAIGGSCAITDEVFTEARETCRGQPPPEATPPAQGRQVLH